MGDIVTVLQVTETFNRSVTNAVGNELIRQAEGLVKEILAPKVTVAPWPMVAETTVLAMVGRPLINPKAATRTNTDSVGTEHGPRRMGVYLTDEERKELEDWVKKPDPQRPSSPGFGTIRVASGYPSIDDCDYFGRSAIR